MGLKEKWQKAVAEKDSILCAGLDIPSFGEGAKQGKEKFDFALDFVEKVSPYCSAIKPNRQFLLDLTRQQIKGLTKAMRAHNVVSIVDHKLADIGNTNESALFHISAEGFDSLTYCPFPGNVRETAELAHKYSLGLIVLTLMSNPEFEAVKHSVIEGKKAYVYFAEQVAKYADAVVVGAPSPKNHVTSAEIQEVKQIIGDKLALVPGIGAQGGEESLVIKTFGDNAIINVGRAILGAADPVAAAKEYRDRFNRLR